MYTSLYFQLKIYNKMCNFHRFFSANFWVQVVPLPLFLILITWYIRRFTKKKLSTVNREEIDIMTFTGEKKSSMPYYQADFAVLLLKLLCNQVIIVNKSTEENFSSIKSPKKMMKFQTTTIIAKEMQKSLSKHEIKAIVFYSPLKNKLFLILQQY